MFLLIFCCSLASCALRKDAKIIVVGAGLAGVSAASRLVENGYTNVIILEAGVRMGGRITTLPFADNVVDLGGQWLHTGPGSVLYEMVKDHNVLDVTPDNYFEGDFLSSEGEIHSDYAEARIVCNYVFREKPGCEKYWARPYGEFFMNGLVLRLVFALLIGHVASFI